MLHIDDAKKSLVS